MLSGAMLAFARAMGEYGSLVFISGDRPFSTEVASLRIFGLYENGQNNQARGGLAGAAVALARRPARVRRRLRRRLTRPEVTG